MRNISKLFLVLVVVVLLSNSGCVARWLAHRRSIDHYVTAMALRSGDFNEDAVLELQAAVDLNKQFGLAHSMLCDIYREGGQPEKAAEAYEDACQLDPWSFSDHFHLGEVYQILERFGEAVEVVVPVAFGVEERLASGAPEFLDDRFQRRPVELVELVG